MPPNQQSYFTNNVGGFFGDRGANPSYSQYDLIIIPEEDGLVFNDTLATSSCPGDNEEG